MARLNRQRLRICCVQLSLYSLGIIATLCGAGSQKSNDAEALFEAKYKAWREYCNHKSRYLHGVPFAPIMSLIAK